MHLGWIDYVILILLLIFSGGIGLYQGCIRSKQKSTKEFLVADGQMKVILYFIEFISKTFLFK
jgi:Na+/proline symporter